MFDTNNTKTREVMALKHTEASQLARPRRNRNSQAPGEEIDAGISIHEADTTLHTLVQLGFFHKTGVSAVYYSLAPRALMELRAYLKETYNEPPSAPDADDGITRIRDCEGCRDIVTHGIRCSNRECGVRWHDACANSYYRGRREGGRKCPVCETECSGDVYVGVRADKPGKGRRSVVEREEDEEAEEEE
jgi:hypothetical protein